MERCIDTGDMTKFDGRVYYGIESIYKMITSVMINFVLITAPCQALAKHLQSPPSDISELPNSNHGAPYNYYTISLAKKRGRILHVVKISCVSLSKEIEREMHRIQDEY